LKSLQINRRAIGRAASRTNAARKAISKSVPNAWRMSMSVHSLRPIAFGQTLGRASKKKLRQAMIHCRTLFEEVVGEPEIARAKGAS
jgi:hypothetical protein